MTICIFLGPSLPVEEARSILEAEYLPPVACGDVYAAMRRQPRAIGIIDGVFGQQPPVWHKEILYALSQGTAVFGASSMGALRAAELAPLGMQGIGSVYEAYAQGTYEDDDEVAVAHGSADLGFRPLSEAMVNLRHGLEMAYARGAISKQTRDQLMHAAKRRFYPERSWMALFADGQRIQLPGVELVQLEEFVRTERPNLKREDAIALLRHLARLAESEPTTHVANFDFNATCFWNELAQTVDERSDAAERAEHPAAALRDKLRVATFNRSDILRDALLAVLVMAEVNRQGIEVTEEAVQDEMRHLRAQRPHVSDDDLAEIAILDGAISAVIAARADELSEPARLALLRRGEHARVAAEVEEQQRFLREIDGESPQLADAEIGFSDIIAWYAREHGLGECSIEQCAERLGFGNARRFLDQLIAHYRVERQSLR